MLQNLMTYTKKLVSSRLVCLAILLVLSIWFTSFVAVSHDVLFGGVKVAADEENVNVYSLTPKIPTCMIHIQVDGEVIDKDVPLTTIEKAVEAAGITLADTDQIKPSKTINVSEDMKVVITRVRFEERTVNEKIASKIIYRVSSSVKTGEKKLSKKGNDGSKQVVYTDKYVNGKLVSSKKKSETIQTKANDTIYLVGSMGTQALSPCPYALDLDEKGQPVKYKELKKGRCTAYTSDRGNAGTVCSTGRKAQVGVVAVDPDVIPYGTELYIVSPDGKIVYGYAIAGDTGGGVLSGRALLDLFMDTYDECIQFGHRQMNVYILN